MANENIYSAPAASFTDTDFTEKSSSEMKFYVVAPYKFLLLFICTMGFYKVYWFYKNWSRYKAWGGGQESIWPAPRGFFSVFFTHSLFRRVGQTLAENPNTTYSWSADGLAAVFVIAQVIVNLLDRYNQHVDNNVTLGVEFVLMLPVIGTVLFMAQRAINAACDDPTGSSNNKLTWANWIWIVLGSVMLLLILIGIFWGDAGVAGNS